MSVRPEELATRRGLVLIALHEQWPAPLRWAALRGRVRMANDDDVDTDSDKALSRDLEYLVRKDLVRRESGKIAGRQILTYELTVGGVDVVEGSRDEPGITIERA